MTVLNIIPMMHRLAPFALAPLFALVAHATPAPAPINPVPTERQLGWHELEQYGFIHFGLNTYTLREWGYGDEDPKLFNPKEFDADKIVAAFKAGGMKGIVLTAKHHDGFCLWPTKTTGHNITKSPFRGGKGDLVREIGEACRRAGLKFGIYVSPWDRNHPEYGRPGYVKVFHEQIRELMTGYGDLFEVWFDGANGGDGWYGGAKETRSIKRDYYEWDKVIATIRKHQPNAVIFGTDAGDIRWVGNEKGFTEPGSRPIILSKRTAPDPNPRRSRMLGARDGDIWLPAECDVSIRPRWFWHHGDNAAVRSPRNLFDLYFRSVGYGAGFLLNIPPDQRGVVHESDRAALEGFAALLKKTFSNNLASGAEVKASAVRGNTAAFAPEKLLDGDRHSYWSTDDGVTDASVELVLPEKRTFNIVRLREALDRGLRVENWAVDVFDNGAWHEYAQGEVVGNMRLVRGKPVTTDRVRLRLSGGKVAPCVSEFGLFLEPADLGTPTITRTAGGELTIKAASDGVTLRYTTDGKEPDAKSPEFTGPVALKQGGLVKARAFAPNGDAGETATATFGVARGNWRLLDASAGKETADKAFDEKPGTLWHTHEKSGRKEPPQWIAIDMGERQSIAGFTMTPRTDTTHGLTDRYRFEVSEDGKTWKKVAEGEFSNIAANPIEQVVMLKSPVTARYFRFTGLRAVSGNQVAVGELGIISKQ